MVNVEAVFRHVTYGTFNDTRLIRRARCMSATGVDLVYVYHVHDERVLNALDFQNCDLSNTQAADSERSLDLIHSVSRGCTGSDQGA
jgi:hypothetical protein